MNQIWRDAKLRGAGLKRAKTLVEVAEHSIGSIEAPGSARIEIRNLLADYEVYRGRKHLRYALYEAAISVIARNDEFKEIHSYYRTRTKNPLKKMQSVIAVACKLIRIFYAILTKGVDYDGQKMLSDIVRPEALAAA